MTDALLVAIKKFRRTEDISVANVRKRLATTTAKKGIPFDWRKHKTIVERARDKAGWATTGGRYAKWFSKTDTSVLSTDEVRD